MGVFLKGVIAWPVVFASAFLAAGELDHENIARIHSISFQEQVTLARLRAYKPLVELYSSLGPLFGKPPVMDVYWLGRAIFTQQGVDFEALTALPHKANKVNRELAPRAFVQMAVIDSSGIDEDRYEWRYVGQEFVGRLRCVVFDLTPRTPGDGRFKGRIWASEDDNSIVRFNGIRDGNGKHFRPFHFDSWRVCKTQSFCLPSAVYVDERELSAPTRGMTDLRVHLAFWGYQAKAGHATGEQTVMKIESLDKVHDSSVRTVDQEGDWQVHAEENVISWLEEAGALGRSGDVDKILDQVVTNLTVSNNLQLPFLIHCRVLLTTPMELFTVHHTIVVSQSVVATLRDEASLAALLAPEVAHIALLHPIKQTYGFNEWRLRNEKDVYQNVLDFRRSDSEILAADKMAFNLLWRSPYRKELAKVGNFLTTVSERCGATGRLFTPQMGDPIPGSSDLYPYINSLRGLIQMKTRTEEGATVEDVTSALPLWSRIEVDPWSGESRLISPVMGRKYFPFEIGPVALETDRREEGIKIEDADKALISERPPLGAIQRGTSRKMM